MSAVAKRKNALPASRMNAAIASAVEPLESRVLFAAGDLDLSFGGAGTVTLNYFNRNDLANAVVVQSDGKVLVAGTTATGTTTGTDVALARYKPDGTLDTSFGVGGKVVTHLGGTSDSAFALTVQSDGRVLLAGGARAGATGTDFALVRYNADGSLDGTFGSGGIVRTDLGFGGNDLATAMKLTSDGRIVLAGWTTVVGSQQFAAARYVSSGALDTSFGGGDGIAVVEFANGTGQAKALATLADGSMILAGTLMDFDGSGGSDYAAIRLLADGALDTSFGVGGFATVHLGGEGEAANGVLVTADGGIVLVGASSQVTQQVVGVARLTGAGLLDTTFGGGEGYVLTSFAGGINFGSAAHLQGDGKIVVAGSAMVNGLSRFAIARYEADGSLDASFAGGGKITYGFPAGESFGKALAADGQGRLVIAGNVSITPGNFDFGVLRLENQLNVLPVAHAGGAYTVNAGDTIVLDGTGSSDADGWIAAFEWDFDYDGNTFDPDAVGATPTFTAPTADGGTTRTVALRCIDNHGALSITTTTITINLPPPPPQDPGSAVLVADPDAPGKQMLSVKGTAGSDRVRFKAGKKGNVEVRLGNRKLGTFSGMTRIIVDAGAGNDVIDARKVNVPVVLFGGAGSDVLAGGKADDILVGGAGDDVMFGGRGRNVIVGGAGRDALLSLQGNDLLIGGSLGLEDDVASMPAVLAEWSRPDRSLSQRIANLMDGGGKNGSVKLSGHVEEDNARDTLLGSTGADWLLSGAGDRVVRMR